MKEIIIIIVVPTTNKVIIKKKKKLLVYLCTLVTYCLLHSGDSGAGQRYLPRLLLLLQPGRRGCE